MNPVFAARALRDFGDGFVAILLPVYLTALGLSAFQVGLVATLALFGSASYEFSETIEATLEARFSQEDKAIQRKPDAKDPMPVFRGDGIAVIDHGKIIAEGTKDRLVETTIGPERQAVIQCGSEPPASLMQCDQV